MSQTCICVVCSHLWCSHVLDSWSTLDHDFSWQEAFLSFWSTKIDADIDLFVSLFVANGRNWSSSIQFETKLTRCNETEEQELSVDWHNVFSTCQKQVKNLSINVTTQSAIWPKEGCWTKVLLSQVQLVVAILRTNVRGAQDCCRGACHGNIH